MKYAGHLIVIFDNVVGTSYRISGHSLEGGMPMFTVRVVIHTHLYNTAMFVVARSTLNIWFVCDLNLI